MASQNVVRTCVMEWASRGVGVGVRMEVGVDVGEGGGAIVGTGDGALLLVRACAASGRCRASATPLISRKVASHTRRMVSVSRRISCAGACTSRVRTATINTGAASVMTSASTCQMGSPSVFRRMFIGACFSRHLSAYALRHVAHAWHPLDELAPALERAVPLPDGHVETPSRESSHRQI